MSTSKRRSVIGVSGGCFRFPMCCSVAKQGRFRGDWSRKSRPNFARFDSYKITGWRAQCLSEFGDAENAGVEIAAPKCTGGNRGRRKSMEN